MSQSPLKTTIDCKMSSICARLCVQCTLQCTAFISCSTCHKSVLTAASPKEEVVNTDTDLISEIKRKKTVHTGALQMHGRASGNSSSGFAAPLAMRL